MGETFNMSVKTTYKGKFASLNVGSVIEQQKDMYLRRVGDAGVKAMRAKTSPHDWSGELTDSIAWRTDKEASNVSKAENLIDAPNNIDSVDIGSKCKYAFFREFGAGIHGTTDGSAEFIDRMKQWFVDKIGGDPEGEDSAGFWAIVNSIRYGDKAQSHTQNKSPFVVPSIPEIITAAKHYSRIVTLSKYLGR